MAEEGTRENPIVIHPRPRGGVGIFANMPGPAPEEVPPEPAGPPPQAPGPVGTFLSVIGAPQPEAPPAEAPAPAQGVGFFSDMSPAERAAARTVQGVRGRYQTPSFDAPAEPDPRDPLVNYDIGAPMSLRIDASRMDNPREMALLLAKRVGPGKFGQDQYGNWWVDQGGERVAIFPKGSLIESTKNLGAGMAGTSPAMAGALGGALIGEAVFPLGGGIPGAMIGAIGGKGIDEINKYFAGLLDKAPLEQAGAVLNEGAIAGAFQGAAPAVRALKPTVQAGARWLGGVTPESATMAGDLMAGGARAPIASLAPDLKRLEYKRDLRNRVLGDPVEAERGAYLDDRVKNLLTASGVPRGTVDRTIAEVQDTAAAISSRRAGEGVVSRFQAADIALVREEQAQRAAAENALRGLEGSVRAWATAPADLADRVANAIRTSKRQFTQRMEGVYTTIDNIAGNRPVVDTAMIRNAAREIVDVMDPTAVPPILRRWAAEDAPQTLTFAEAHSLRTTLREMSENAGVTPLGQRLGNIADMARATDDAIRGVALGDDISGRIAQDALRQADRLYAEGIRQYTDATLNKLVKDVRSGLIPDPSLVARTIAKAGQSATTQRLRQMLGSETWAQVQRADMANRIQAASYVDRNGQRMLDGQTFLRLLDEPATTVIQDGRMLGQLRELARSFAVLDGKMNVDALAPSAIRDQLQRALGARRAADEFARANPKVAIGSAEPELVDRAANYIIQPGAEARTAAALRTLGRDSAEWREVQRYAVKQLLHDIYVPTQALGRRVSGKSIEEAFAKYTPRQQEMIFGPGLRDDLRLLAREARFLFPKDGRDFGTSLAAASIKQETLPSFSGVRKYFWSAVSGFISDNPKVIGFLAHEIRTDPAKARTTMSVIRQSVINSLLSGPGAKKLPQGELPAAPAIPVPPPAQPAARRTPAYALD